MKQEIKFSFFWKVGQIWWLIFLPAFFMHWLAPFIAGLIAKKRKWVLWGVYYLFTVVLLFVAVPAPNIAFRSFAIGLFIFSWLANFVHSIVISIRFIKVMIDKRLGHSIKKQEKLSREYSVQLKSLSPKHRKIMHTMLIEKKEILENYNNIDPILQNDMLDMLEMVESYIDYARELMTKEEEIEKIMKGINLNQIEGRTKQLKLQISKTSNIKLKNEYLEAIDNYQKQKNAYQNFKDKRKTIDLKLESNIGKLREIKYDLIEMKFKVSENEKGNMFKKVNQLSEDMTVFVENLKDTHKELNL